MLTDADAQYAEPPSGQGQRIEPIPLAADLGRSAEYPVNSLGQALRDATKITAVHAAVPLSIAAQSTLAAVSLAVQAHFDVKLPTGQRRPTSLHLVTVAASGERKSTSDEFVMAAIRAFQERLEEEFERKKVDCQHSQAAWDETRKAITQTNKNKGRETLEEAYRELGRRPDGPIDPHMVVRSGTTQGLLKRFLTSRPSLGLMSDEGGSWLGGFGMTDDNRLLTISTLSDFWDGQAVQMNTGGEGFTALRGKRLAFHLMIQPILAGRLLGNAEAQGQGFLSRLLVTYPDTLAGTRFVDPETREDYSLHPAVVSFRQRLTTIIEAPLPTMPETQVLQPRVLELTREAAGMWWAFYNSLEARLGPGKDLEEVKGFVGKLPEQAARIAANLAVFEQGVRVEHLDTQTLARGISIAEFYLSEAVRLFGQAGPSEEVANAQLLVDWLREKWTENLVNVTAISNLGPNRVRQGGDYIKSLIEILVRHDYLIPCPDGGMISGKKVRTCWRVIR